MTDIHRRSAILFALRVPLVAATISLTRLTGCSRAPTSYVAADVTGMAYGKPFPLHGSDGRQHVLSDFNGRYVMLLFGFTQCPDVCPTALSRAVQIRHLLGADGAKVQVIFVTIDPERDTPALLAEYMAVFDPTFLGLSGDANETAQVAKDFKIFYQKVPNGSSYAMDHSATTYILDTNGAPRLAFSHNETAQQCATDIQTLMDQAST